MRHIFKVLILSVLLAPSVYARETDGAADGDSGVLNVFGALTESACQLDMGSADQTINMGSLGAAELRQVGDQGAPVAVEFRLRDCIRSASNNPDMTGNLSWSASQPAVSLTFISSQDDVNPQLVKANGVHGVGLRLTDSNGREMDLGQASKPQFLTPGSDVLTYYIIPERTEGSLRTGPYSANVNFRLSYE